MLNVVSVSLGSSRRDADRTMVVLGREVRVQRRGVNGDLAAARALIAELDGTVDAIGLGGIDLYLQVKGARYYFREARALARAAKRTPVVCGAGLKGSLERSVVAQLEPRLGWAGRKVLMVSGADRFGMAEALDAHGAKVLYGDLMFALGIPIRLWRLASLAAVARVLGPVVTRLPFKWIYPTGEKQDRPATPAGPGRYAADYAWAEVIAGDWHLIRRHAPAKMAGKVVLTNTTTEEDVDFLRRAGVQTLITTTPRLDGRSVGTNLLEAALVAIEGGGAELSEERYRELIAEAKLGPTVLEL